MCVKMSNMKTASVRQIQHNLSQVLDWVERGEEVLVFRRKRMIARLSPATPRPTESPDFVARARAVWGTRPRGKRLSAIALDARGKR